MLSIFIPFAIIGIILVSIGLLKNRDNLTLVGWAVFVIVIAFGVFSIEYNESHIPEGFEKLDSYYYIAETGEIREIEGPFYFNPEDGTYYTQKPGKTLWIPFTDPDYEPVDLPESNAAKNDSTTTPKCPSCGYSCATPYCGNCGNKIPLE